MGAYAGVTMAAAGASAPLVVNQLKSLQPYFSMPPSWALGVLCTVSAGASLQYDVEVTGDQVPAAGGNWNKHDTLFSQVASANGNVGYPITAIRINVTSYTSGTVNMAVVQWP